MKCAILLISFLFVVSIQAWVKEQENPGLFEGDMVLDPEQQKQYKAGKLGYATTIGRQWPRGYIYYSIDGSLANNYQAKDAINLAIKEYHRKTCIKFERRTNQWAYMEFFDGGACYSPVGYSGGKVSVSLGQGCWSKGTAVHEIAHALGVLHEQSRPDRDDYVTIHWENIQTNMAYNFNKQSGIDSLGTPYDFNSVMHYKALAFSKNGRATITKKSDGSTYFGNDYGLSTIDARQLNLLYKKQCGGGTGTYTQTPVTKKPWTQGPKTRDKCQDTHSACGSTWPKNQCSLPGVAFYCKKMCSKC